MADDELLLDELGTERARRELARAFAERGVPGEFEQGLFRFGFAGLVARVEVMANARPTIAHLHMTLSCPALSSAVLDCCSGVGEGPADALRNGVEQWLAGPYWAYHDAFAHDHAPTWLFERSGESWHVFEAPLQAHGCEGDVLERIVAAEPLRMLLSAPELEHLSPLAAHRIRWVYGSAGTAEVFVDEHFDPRLSKRLREFEWPAPVPLLLRHSAVLLVRERAEQRQAQNLSLDGLHDALQHSATLVEAGQEPTVISHLLHGIELNPTHPRIPALCARWSRWAMRSRDAHSARPLDLPLSSALLSAYVAMAEGEAADALGRLVRTLARSPALDDSLAAHLVALASSYAEWSLPPRRAAIINFIRDADERRLTPTEIAVSSLEAPSAVAAMREQLPELALSYVAVKDADRLARSKTAVVLWDYAAPGVLNRLRGVRRNEPVPAVPAPDVKIADAVAGIAGLPYSRAEYARTAQQFALGLSDAHVPELLRAMVHPRRLPGLSPWDSRFRVMVAAAFTIAQLCLESSAGQPAWGALLGLLDGPVDWTTTAALLALTDLALRRPETELALIAAITSRLSRPVTPIWYQCFVEPAHWLLLRLPRLPAPLSASLIEGMVAESNE